MVKNKANVFFSEKLVLSISAVLLVFFVIICVLLGVIIHQNKQLDRMQIDVDQMVPLEETELLDVLKADSVSGWTNPREVDRTVVPGKVGAEKLLGAMEGGYFLKCGTNVGKDFRAAQVLVLVANETEYRFEVLGDIIAYTAGDAPTVYYRSTHAGEFCSALRNW